MIGINDLVGELVDDVYIIGKRYSLLDGNLQLRHSLLLDVLDPFSSKGIARVRCRLYRCPFLLGYRYLKRQSLCS